MQVTAEPIRTATVVFRGSTPCACDFDDDYFMAGRSLAESQAVFLQANALPQRFAALERDDLFVIGETGFGSGLNDLLAADSFRRLAPASARLQIFSAEKYPLRKPDLVQALRAWPELAGLADTLLAHYPPPVPGYHRVPLLSNVELVLMYGDAGRQWRAAQVAVDAWFLDGFAPACNPDMWSASLFEALASHSRPGASFGTFTAAGQVRRGLSAAGFEVDRVTGFEGKRHRLVGAWPGRWQARRQQRGSALIAGAGLAGASTARALAEAGWQVRVIDRAGPASGASGNPAGIVYTTPSPHLTAQNRFYQSAFIRALSWLRHYGFPASSKHGALSDVIQWPSSERQRIRLTEAAASGAWPPELLELREDGSARLLGGGYLDPRAWCHHLLDHPAIRFEQGEIAAIEPEARAQLVDGRKLEADALVLCLAHHSVELPGLNKLPIKRIRGQITEIAATAASLSWQQAHCHAGYLTPAMNGRHMIGASFDLKRPSHGLDPADNEANLAQLAAFLPEHWRALGGEDIEPVGERAGVRCQSTDFLPQSGPLPDQTGETLEPVPGLWLNIAHGSRGLTHTPLAADLLASQLAQRAASLEPEIVAALSPGRFLLRRQGRRR